MSETEKRKVLIADDEPGMRSTLSDILSENGFNVSTAEDGLSAVQMCERDQYDVVLMDVRMPGIDGVEAFRRIQQIQKGVHIILMSAYGEEGIKNDTLEEGAIAFLDKPLNLDTVIQLVSNSSGLTILAITDDDGLISKLPACFASGREQLTVVRSSHEAQKLVRQLNFDVALIDAELPSTNGLDCYLSIRQMNATITAIMICKTDHKLLELAGEAVRQTAYTVIEKPLRPKTLSDLVAQLKRQRISGAVRKPGSDQ